MTRPTVLVGLDDSAAALAALAWAARYCRRTASALRAVNVLQWPIGIASIGRPAEQLLFLPEREVSSDYRQAIRGIFRDVEPEASWLLTFAEGDAGEVLVHLTKDNGLSSLWLVRRSIWGSGELCWVRSVTTASATPAARWLQFRDSPDRNGQNRPIRDHRPLDLIRDWKTLDLPKEVATLGHPIERSDTNDTQA
jgi:hypothetical protein